MELIAKPTSDARRKALADVGRLRCGLDDAIAAAQRAVAIAQELGNGSMSPALVTLRDALVALDETDETVRKAARLAAAAV